MTKVEILKTSPKNNNVDSSRAAKRGFWLAITGLIFGLTPFLPILFNGLGLMFSLKGRHSSRRRLATAGVVIASLGLIWNFFYGPAYLSYLHDLEKKQTSQK